MLRQTKHKLKKVQITTCIRTPEESLIEAVGREVLEERGYPCSIGECLERILATLRNDDRLTYTSHDTSKHEVFRLRDDPATMIQISNKGKIIITLGSPESFSKVVKILYNAVWFNGYSSWILEPFKAKIYRVEEYSVESLRDIESLFIHQTIVGARKE